MPLLCDRPDVIVLTDEAHYSSRARKGPRTFSTISARSNADAQVARSRGCRALVQ